MRPLLHLAVLASFVAGAGCEPAPEGRALTRHTQAIIDGTAAPDEESVVAVVSLQNGGGLCTGTVVADRVVLTAKHCVQQPGADAPNSPGNMRVGIGPKLDPFGGQMRFLSVVDIVTTPGSFEDNSISISTDLVGKDVAVITLQESAGVPAVPMKLTDPHDEKGKPATAIGYGQTPSAGAGEKFKVGTTVDDVTDISVQVIGTVCQGDSGGPLLNSERKIIGVVSVGEGSGCGIGGPSLYQRIDIFADLILGAIKKSGDCSNDGPEACDGFDNDCDDKVDEDCVAAGGKCTSDDQCVTRLCADTRDGKICTSRCDPLSPGVCQSGFICAATDKCEGLCVPGKLGPKAFGESCEDSSECASLFCDDPGDGQKRCAAVCRGGEGTCLANEACVAGDGACGSCVDATLVSGKLGQDEPCKSDDGCRSGVCFDDGGSKYCAATCSADQDCDAMHHCRDNACVRGPRGVLGGGCSANEDCEAGFFCAKTKAGAFCTRVCDPSKPCDAGFSCEQVSNGKACLPDGSVVGGACSADGDCLSKKCFVQGKVCTRDCSNAAECGPGLDCARSSLGSPGLCLNPKVVALAPTDAPAGSGDGQAGAEEDAGDPATKKARSGCAVAAADTPSSAGLAVLGLGLVAALRRRRAQRRPAR